MRREAGKKVRKCRPFFPSTLPGLPASPFIRSISFDVFGAWWFLNTRFWRNARRPAKWQLFTFNFDISLCLLGRFYFCCAQTLNRATGGGQIEQHSARNQDKKKGALSFKNSSAKNTENHTAIRRNRALHSQLIIRKPQWFQWSCDFAMRNIDMREEEKHIRLGCFLWQNRVR